MNLNERAKRDAKNFSGDKVNGFGVDLTFTSKADPKQTAAIVGIYTKHHLGVGEEGNMVNSRTVFVSFSESALTDANANYPVRNAKGEVDLVNHLVEVDDKTSIKKYMIQGIFPDEKLGFILLSLEYYKE